ncbi:ABC transporter substrate-binding protein [Oscillospiraceae bacterium MB08-C2-2]|nr:ABC transporter substrate-binding protein [Oscillospiraceae bacterium MB08-C2-2]
MRKRTVKALLCMILVLSMVFVGCGQAAPAASSEAGTQAAPAGDGASAESSAQGAPGGKVKVALVGPMTGDSAQYGQQFQRGVEVFIEEYNSKGGYNGSPIALTVFDDKNDAKEAVNIGNKIVSEGDYFAVIGPFSSTCALAMAEVLDEEKVLTISPSVSHPDYVTNFDYTFRLSHVNTIEGAFVAKYCAQKWGSQKMAAIYSQNDWGMTLDEAFLEGCKEQNLEVVANEPFILGQTKDFSPIITKIKQAGADTVFLMCQYAEAGQLLQQIRGMGLNDIKIFVSSSAYKGETLELAGEAAEGALWCSTFMVDNPDPLLQAFRKTVKEKYDAEVDNMIVRAYDCMMVAFTALDKSQKMDSDSIKNEIMDIREFTGVSGTFKFFDDRNVDRRFYITGPDGNGSYKFLEDPELK